MVTIDGSRGEGGGQVLRTSLSLSLLTGQPFRMIRIRAGRPKPGLQRQHLVAVHAAAEVGRAQVSGAELGSHEITFVPGELRAGDYEFHISGAGSTTLVLQTILLPLLHAARPSTVRLTGGTHNPFAPPYEFLDQVFAPLLRRMGAEATMSLRRPGFYPAGGGDISVRVAPCAHLAPIQLLERGPVRRIRAFAYVARLPRQIAERELTTLRERFALGPEHVQLIEVPESPGPGNAVSVQIEAQHVTELFTAFGQRGVPAERVAAAVADEAQEYLAAGVPVGRHLADQLLLPLVLAGAGSFRTQPLSKHAQTNCGVIGQFLQVPIKTTCAADGSVRVDVGQALSG